LKLQIVGRVMSVELCHHAKFCGDRSNPCRDIAIFGFFKLAAAAISHFYNFIFLTVETERKSNCVTVSNFVEIAHTVAEIWRSFDFLRWRQPPSWIF